LEYRKPILEDLAETVKLLFRFREEFGNLFPEADLNMVAQTVEQHNNYGFIHNAYSDGNLVGSIGAIPSQWWFSSEKFISETWFYVLPKYRNYKTAKKLLAELKKYAGNRIVLLPVSTGFDKPQLYKRLKFKNMGNIWRYN